MHFKAGLLAVAAATSALASETVGQNQIQIHRQFQLENGQTCVTKQPIQGCQAGFQPVYQQENQRSVEMYCLDNGHPMANQMAQIMETGHRLRALQQEAEKRTQRVPKIERCQTSRLTKNGEIQERTHVNQQTGLRKSGKQFESKEEQKQHFETIRRDQKEKLQQLQKLMPSIEKAVQLSESDYEEAYKLIKHIARQDEQVEGALYMLQNSLPHQYVQAVQRIQKQLEKELIKNERKEESEKTREVVEEIHQQLKKLASRTYLYTLVQIVKEQQKQSISEQMETSFNKWEQFEQQFERLWNKVQRDIENEKIVEQIERQVERFFQKQITEEEKQQLKAWQLNLQNQEQEQKHQQSWEQQQPKEWETKMTRQQRERQQILLTKIVLASLFKTVEQEKVTKEQEKSGSPLFSGLFSKKQNYEQLIKQVKSQFQHQQYQF